MRMCIVPAAGLLVAALSGASAFASFSLGNLVVSRVGDGQAALSGSTAAVFLDEYSTSGAFIDSLGLPTTASGSNFALTLGGTSTSQGQLGRSTDTRYITVHGYDAPVGTTGPASNAGFRGRTVALVDQWGNIDTRTRFEVPGATPRMAATVDGGGFWIAGELGSNAGGLRYVPYASTTNGTQVTAAPTNVRTVNIFNGQLYIGSATGVGGDFRGVSAVGTGLPTTSGQTSTLLQGMGGSNLGLSDSTYDFFFANATTLYVADDDTTAPASGGIQKWTFDGTTWNKAWQIAPTARSITGRLLSTGEVELFAISALSATTGSTDLIRVLDTGVGTPTSAVLATSGTNTVFRGVEFAPVPEPTTLAALGFVAAGLLRHRRG